MISTAWIDTIWFGIPLEKYTIAMRTVIVAAFFLGCISNRNQQLDDIPRCEYQYDKKLKYKVYSKVDEWPEFPGGGGEMYLFMAKNMSVFFDGKEADGKVFINLIIDAQGNVVSEHIKNKAIADYTELEKEALRVVRLMPKWKPGKCKNRKVAVRQFLPLIIHPRS